MVRTRQVTGGPHEAAVLSPTARQIRFKVSGDGKRLGLVIQQLLKIGSSVEVALEPDSGDSLASLESLLPMKRFARRLQVHRSGGRIRYLKVEDVNWIEAANQYVRLHSGSCSYLVRESMAKLSNRLDPQQFMRIHRSAIVNLDHVQELHAESSTHCWAILVDGHRLPISQSHRESLKTALIG